MRERMNELLQSLAILAVKAQGEPSGDGLADTLDLMEEDLRRVIDLHNAICIEAGK